MCQWMGGKLPGVRYSWDWCSCQFGLEEMYTLFKTSLHSIMSVRSHFEWFRVEGDHWWRFQLSFAKEAMVLWGWEVHLRGAASEKGPPWPAMACNYNNWWRNFKHWWLNWAHISELCHHISTAVLLAVLAITEYTKAFFSQDIKTYP